MKKILSILVLAALLLTALCATVSAGAYYDRSTGVNYKDAKYQVRRANVTIDGIVSPGEYDEVTDYCEWYIGEMASSAYTDAENLAKSLKWYFSWDGVKYFQMAVVFDAGQGANQTYPGGTYFDDHVEDVPPADEFLGYGPGICINSEEISPLDEYWSRFYFAISENTATGEGIVGIYGGQNGQPDSPYTPVHGTDFDVTYNGSIVTIEWKIPVYQLTEKFTEGKETANFKASMSVHAGLFTADLAAEGESKTNTYAYGARLGMLGYNCDSSVEDLGNATFLLTKNEIPSVGGEATTQAPVTDPETTAPVVGTDPETTAPVVGTDPETTAPVVGTDPETTAPVAGEDDPETTAPVGDDNKEPEESAPVVDDDQTPVENPGNKPVAPSTGDPMIIAAVVSALSACGVMIAKKRK